MKERPIVSHSNYTLPKPVREQCIWIIRDMNRLREVAGAEYEAPDVITARMRIAALEQSLETIPPEYREGLLRNISGGVPFGMKASESTWLRWKQRLLYTFAMHLGLY
ncbi:MAG: hypothetical protein IJH91_06095 [Mogibacterium sp.]|nr:hypothetical protein [Mogibacterium sp.]